MGQDAAMAIEDRATLAACLVAAGAGDPAQALRHYERLCLPRVTRPQDMSRVNKTCFHMPDHPARRARHAAQRSDPSLLLNRQSGSRFKPALTEAALSAAGTGK
jgi:salicylate hydroxylase